MNYPIVQVQTTDGMWLHGLFIEAKKPKAVFLNVHGTASNFYEEDFIEVMTEKFLDEGISMLSTNNRGTGVYDAWDKKGAASEIFEDCLIDIDAWIEFIIEKGYTKIILSGHSLGTEKVVYYMGFGKYKTKINAVVLLAPADSPRWRYYDDSYKVPGSGETGKARVDLQVRDAQKMINEDRGDELMDRTVYGGVMPKTPKSFLNFMADNTEILKALPLHSGRLELYGKITVPIFVAIGDRHEYTGIPIVDALELMKRENQRTEAYQIKDCNHDFEEKEEELTNLVSKFICNTL